MVRANELTATEALSLMRTGKLSVEEMAQACLARIRERDPTVRGWVYLDPDLVLRNARELDKREIKGPLHGVPIAVKDVIMTADMPTQHNSPLYKESFPTVDAGCIKTLRAAGALIFGKTDTTEFAAVTRGGTARHPLDASRTPGGSSSGSAAVVADMQAPIGSRHADCRLDDPSRFVLRHLRNETDLGRDQPRRAQDVGAEPRHARPFRPFGGRSRSARRRLRPRGPDSRCALRFARRPHRRLPLAGLGEDGTGDARRIRAWGRPAQGSRRRGRRLLELPPAFSSLADHQTTVMFGEARASFLSEIRAQPELLHEDLTAMARNSKGITRAALIAAYDAAAQCRMAFDEIAAGFDAVLTPSARGEAPVGNDDGRCGRQRECGPCCMFPSFRSRASPARIGLPVGLSLISPRYTDRRLLSVAKEIGPIFGAQARPKSSAAAGPSATAGGSLRRPRARNASSDSIGRSRNSAGPIRTDPMKDLERHANWMSGRGPRGDQPARE